MNHNKIITADEIGDAFFDHCHKSYPRVCATLEGLCSALISDAPNEVNLAKRTIKEIVSDYQKNHNVRDGQ